MRTNISVFSGAQPAATSRRHVVQRRSGRRQDGADVRRRVHDAAAAQAEAEADGDAGGGDDGDGDGDSGVALALAIFFALIVLHADEERLLLKALALELDF